jgi:hypothetical protein
MVKLYNSTFTGNKRCIPKNPEKNFTFTKYSEMTGFSLLNAEILAKNFIPIAIGKKYTEKSGWGKRQFLPLLKN